MPHQGGRSPGEKGGSTATKVTGHVRKEVHCVGAGLVPARTAGGCGPQSGHKGRPYVRRMSVQTFNLVDALHQAIVAKGSISEVSRRKLTANKKRAPPLSGGA
jgi:hypothetical protein